MCSHHDDPSYLAYLEEMDAAERRAQARRMTEAPMRWGDPVDGGYFCEPCWFRGDATGAHSFEVPPCDPLPRGWRFAAAER